MKRKLTIGLVFALILFLTTLTALAMELSGADILDWLYRRDPKQEMTTTIPIVHGTTRHRVASLELRELITDGYGVYLSLAVTPIEKGTLFLSNGVNPYVEKAAELGFATDDPEQTVAEWASTNGYNKLRQIRLYSAYTINEDGSTTSENLCRVTGNPMRIESDGTSVFMIACENKGEGHVYKFCYRVLTYPDKETYPQAFDGSFLNAMIIEEDDYNEQIFTFSVDMPKGMEAEILAEYLPDPAHEQSAEFPKVTGVRILRTPLAIYYDVAYTKPSPEDLRRYYFGEPNFWEGQLFDTTVWMGGWYTETLPDGSTQFHELSSCALPESLPEQLSIECSMQKRDPEFGDTVGHVYDHVPCLRE